MKTPEQLAQLKIKNEMAARVNTSIYDAGGRLNQGAAMALSDGQVSLGEYLDMSTIPFAPDPHGSDHATWLGRLVVYIAQLPESVGGIVGGPLSNHDVKILHAVGMLYACGKAQGAEGYEARSAAIADKYFREGGGARTYWSTQEVREEVCRLIYKHNDEREIGTDKRLQVFSDACRFETSRLAPNTAEGMALIRERCDPRFFITGWAKDKANFRGWMIARGWK